MWSAPNGPSSSPSLVWRSSPSHVSSDPQSVSSASHTSGRPNANPNVLNPIDSSAQLPAKMMRSAHDNLLPYFCLIGHSSRRALSRFPLSGQLFSGAKRWCPDPPPPRPSLMR